MPVIATFGRSKDANSGQQRACVGRFPSDAREERATVRDHLNDWSVTSGARQGVVLLPWLYERHAVATMGGRAQALINSQAVDRADVVVAFFDARLGTDTGVDVSGTAEEINRAIDRGTPVHVYFSREDIPRDADLEQVAALNAFKQQLETRGLLGDYIDPDDLAAQVVRAIQMDIDAEAWADGLIRSGRSGASLVWRHVNEREQVGVDSKGKVKTRTRRNDLLVRNESDTAAEDLTFSVRNADGTDDYPFHFDGPDGPVTLHGRSERRWRLIPHGPCTLEIEAHWSENGLPKSKISTVVAR